MNNTNSLAGRIKLGLGVALLAALTGCVGYVDGGYGGDVVVGTPGVWVGGVWDGGFVGRGVAHGYSSRGRASRGAATQAAGAVGRRQAVSAERHIAQNQTSQTYETFKSIDTFCRHFDDGDCGRGLRRFARDTPRRGAESRRRATLVRVAGGGRQGLAGGRRSQRQSGACTRFSARRPMNS